MTKETLDKIGKLASEGKWNKNDKYAMSLADKYLVKEDKQEEVKVEEPKKKRSR